jgi:hypothetical protein
MTLKRYLLTLLIFAGVAGFQSCKKDDAPPPTTLELTIKDNLGNAVSGATVKLYTSVTDFGEQKNQFGETHFTDASGKVTITGISNLQYYWFVEKDCKNNFTGGVTSESNLLSNKTNAFNVIINSTGILKFSNNSANPYKIFINGTELGQIDGNTTTSLPYVPTGSYSIRVLQVSGYAVYPTDKTYTGTLDCGSTLTTTFPNNN